MCEIQFIFKLKENINDLDINAFKKMLEMGSINNYDAFGLFNEYVIFKRKGKVKFKGLDLKVLKDSNFLIGHNRFKTRGTADNNFNNHPFFIDDFVLCHNGTINNDDDLRNEFKITHKTKTDSFIILELISHYFNKNNSDDRTTRIKKAIKKTCKKIIGSYSVFLLDNKTKNIYYFKNNSTSFSILRIGNHTLIGSTDIRKHTYLYNDYENEYLINYKDRKLLKIEDEKIYLINKEKGIREIGSFKENDKPVIWNTNYTDYADNILNKESEDFDDYYNDDKENIISQIDEILNNTLGYIPSYTYNNFENNILIDKSHISKEGLLFLRNYVLDITKDKYTIDILKLIEEHIY